MSRKMMWSYRQSFTMTDCNSTQDFKVAGHASLRTRRGDMNDRSAYQFRPHGQLVAGGGSAGPDVDAGQRQSRVAVVCAVRLQAHHARRQGHHDRPVAHGKSQDAAGVQGSRQARQDRLDPGHAWSFRPFRRFGRARQEEQRARAGNRRHGPDAPGAGHPAARTVDPHEQVGQDRAVPGRQDHPGPCRSFFRNGAEGSRDRPGGAIPAESRSATSSSSRTDSRSGTWATPACSAT